jgi:modulator of FtsH protease HflK
MAWNHPGDDKRRQASRGAPAKPSLDNMLRRWQERVQRLWRPGSGRGTAALALLTLAVAVWLGSGYYQVGPSERGVVQRFGRYISTEQPGNGWHWPWPIETLTKLNVASIQGQGPESKATMLTVDQSLINLGWSVQYRIGDPLQYLFQLRDPERTLSQVSETVIREFVAREPLQSLINGDARARLSSDVRERIQQALVSYDAGIDITSVTFNDVQLPEPVLAAQRDAERASDDRQRAINDAQTYASDSLQKAQSTAQKQLTDAQVYATQTVAAAQGDAERFSALADAVAQAPQVTRQRLYVDAMADILSHAHKIFIDAPSGTLIYLPLDKLAEAIKSGNAPANGVVVGNAGNAVPPPAAEPAPNDRAADDSRSRQRVERVER